MNCTFIIQVAVSCLLATYKPRLICLNLLCILTNQEIGNLSTYTRLTLRIYTNAYKHAHKHVRKHTEMLMHACLQQPTSASFCLSVSLPLTVCLSLSLSSLRRIVILTYISQFFAS